MEKIDEKIEATENYNPNDKEIKLRDFLEKRIGVLKNSKKNILDGVDFDKVMKDADDEYAPKDDKGGNVVEVLVERENELTGLRGSKFEKIKSEDDWQSHISQPTLLVKMQTAMSILIDNNPEAVFKAITEKYKNNEAIAKAIWKRNWLLNNGKNVLKLFVFYLMKYGWAAGRTVPRIVKRDKDILEEIDTENPEKNKYRKIEIVEFNDVYKEVLDPHRVWIDDKANLIDPFSLNDWYFEKDFSKDDFEDEFGKFKNSKYVKYSTIEKEGVEVDKNIQRDDMVTVGFYENKSKDLYAIYIPKDKIAVYSSPLPNDEGKLSLWETYWLIRDPRTRLGIGIWEIIKSNKELYDRFNNMTTDQLTMAIYPMLFYTGVPGGEMNLNISPKKIQQKQAGTTIDQVKIDYDQRGQEAVDKQKEKIDDNCGITPTLQGEVEGKTLGEVLHAKNAALKRLNIPMSNIANAIEQDAYLTLSWANQVYSLPEIKEFVSGEDLLLYEEANNVKFNGVNSELPALNGKGMVEGKLSREFELGLEEDREGNLIESNESRFFKIGEGKLPLNKLKWEGKVSVKAMSIISSNPELDRQIKLNLSNILFPYIQAMRASMQMGDIQSALSYYKPMVQILEIHDEKPENWLPDDIIKLAENPEQVEAVEQAKKKEANPLFVDQNQMGENGEVEEQSGATANGQKPTNPLQKVLGGIKAGATEGFSSFQR